MDIDPESAGDESDISIIPAVLPGGTRDFLILRPENSDHWRLLHVVELLSLNRVARTIAQIQQTQPDLAHNLALARLMHWRLQFRGSGRHFAVEPWTEDHLRGTLLTANVRTVFADELKREQARDYLEITTRQQHPPGGTSELFWRAVVDLPELPATSDDPELGRFAKALYLHLVPDGTGMVEVTRQEFAEKVNALWNSGFAALGLKVQARKLRQVFRRLLSLTVHWGGQMAGTAAKGVVLAKKVAGNRPLTDREERLLELRYGACQVLGGVSFGFLNNCGPNMGSLITEYAYQIATGTEAEVNEAEECLRRFAYLVANFRARRKDARADYKRDRRERRADRMTGGFRKPPEEQTDPSVPDPAQLAALHDELEAVRTIITRLKPGNADRMKALLDCGGDRRAAAETLGLDLKTYSRQLRQTVFPAMRRLSSQDVEAES
jgi:hypothetical protein